MFCPVIGVPEDPVSGNAHGMLGVYLVNNGLLAPDEGRGTLRRPPGALRRPTRPGRSRRGGIGQARQRACA